MKLNYTKRGATTVAIALLTGLCFAGNAQTSTNMEAALMSEGITQQRAQELLGAAVPVGGVIPFFGRSQDLPDSWRVCDGSVVTNAQSPLVGKAVPDLRGQFIFGAQTAATVGNQGGTNTLTMASMAHSHGLPSTTGAISISRPPAQVFSALYTGVGDFGTANFQTTSSTGSFEGQHLHDLGGSTASGGPATVSIPLPLPQYTEALFIIRIK